MKEKVEKEKFEQDKISSAKNKVKQTHFELLCKQIQDKKQNVEEKFEIKRLLKKNIDKNVEEHNQFQSEIKEKEAELKNFYRQCLANQISEKKMSKNKNNV